tara:strand:+ start:6478 stop:8826 length:2349 start_codon:yes stop_codon:yes gene_type:complete
MGIGYTRNDTPNNIANGNVISAADLDGEFDAIVSAFVNTTGHTHDGTAAEGGAVSVLGPVQEYLGDGTAFYPKTTAVYTIGKASNTWANLYLDVLTLGGTAVTSTAAELNKLDGYTGTFSDLNKIAAVTATAAELNVLDGVAATLTFTELNYVDGVTSAIQTQLNNKQPLSAVLTATTASFLLADETKLDAIEALADVTDTINVTAAGALMDSELTNLAAVKAIDQSLVTTASPTFNQGNFTTVDTTNLEVSTLKAKDGVSAGGIASVTGVTTLNSAVLTTADINGGTIDNASIGATARSTGLFTTLGTNGLATLASVDINGGNIDATAIGAATRSTGLFTTLGTNSLATLASVDINGGNIDGTVIGAATPAAVTTSSLVATTADINGGTIDGTTIGGSSPGSSAFTTLAVSGLAALTDLTVNGNSYPSAGALSSRNIIINGAMQVSQRTTSTTGVNVGAYRACDRFRNLLDTLGTFTVTQESDGPNGFANSYKTIVTTANAGASATSYHTLQYKIEGQDLQRIAKGTADAQQMTVSFWVKSNVTGTYVFNALDLDNTRYVGATYTVSVSGTWEYKTITIPADVTGALDDNNAASLQIEWWLGSGTNYKSGTLLTAWGAVVDSGRNAGSTINLAATIGNYFQITGVQFELGDTATPFEHRSYGQELQACKRYFYAVDNSLTGSDSTRFGFGLATNTTGAKISIPLHTELRTKPTISYQGLPALSDTNSASTVTSLTLESVTSNNRTVMLAVGASGAGLTQFRPYFLEGTGGNDEKILIDAEL